MVVGIRSCLARVRLFNNLALVIALVALVMTLGLPRVGIVGMRYVAASWAVYLALIVVIVKSANPPELKHASLSLYPSFKPVEYFVMLGIECVLAFGLPLVGVAAGTTLWLIAVIPIMLVGFYSGIKALNKHISETNQQIIRNVWGPDISHRNELIKK